MSMLIYILELCVPFKVKINILQTWGTEKIIMLITYAFVSLFSFSGFSITWIFELLDFSSIF